MLGSLRSLKPGQQGGGFAAKQKHGNDKSSPIGPAKQKARPQNALEAAIQKNHAQAEAEKKGKRHSRALPEWIVAGQRIGYLSKTSRKICEVIIESVNLAKSEVKIVFVDDRDIWKCIPFSMILSTFNPLRHLAPKGIRTRDMTDMLNAAQSSTVDKSIMLQRIAPGAQIPDGVKDARERSCHSDSVAPEPGSARGSSRGQSRSRSRSRSPPPVDHGPIVHDPVPPVDHGPTDHDPVDLTDD